MIVALCFGDNRSFLVSLQYYSAAIKFLRVRKSVSVSVSALSWKNLGEEKFAGGKRGRKRRGVPTGSPLRPPTGPSPLGPSLRPRIEKIRLDLFVSTDAAPPAKLPPHAALTKRRQISKSA